MSEIETSINIKENTPNSSIFPIKPEIIEKFFQKIIKKKPTEYKGLLLDEVEKIIDYDPNFYLDIIAQRDIFLNDFPQFKNKNNFNTGAYLMYGILSSQAEFQDLELPITEYENKKNTTSIKSYRKIDLVNLQDFAFLKNYKEKDQCSLKKREEILHDLSLLTNEEPDICQRLRIADNPSMLVGASFVYSQYRELLEASSKRTKTV